MWLGDGCGIHRLYNTAIRPVATYGGSYWGFPDTTIVTLRRQASLVQGGGGRFRSTTLLCLLSPDGLVDPAYIAHASPILAWSRLVWLRRIPCEELTQVIDWAAASSAEQTEPWRYVTGPGQVYVHAVARLGWAPVSGAELLLDDGRVLDMRVVPPPYSLTKSRRVLNGGAGGRWLSLWAVRS